MRKTLVFSLLVLLTIALVACGTTSGANEEIPGSLRINVATEDGEKLIVGVDEDAELASYVILRSDSTVTEYRDAVAAIRKNILSKTGIELEIKSNPAGIQKAIVIELDSKMGVDEYSITKNGDKVYVKAGSDESMTKVADIFVQYFIYGANKSLLIPAGKGFVYNKEYAIDKLTIDGIDISEFEFYLSPKNKSGFDEVDTLPDVAKIINSNLSKAMGVELKIDNMFYADKNHNIIVIATETDVNRYEIKIEGGDVYLIGSYLSILKAAEEFSTELIGYTDGMKKVGKKVKLTKKDSMTGSLGLTVPYTKDELLSAMEEAYENDEMILSGTHTWDGSMGGTNGTGIGSTESQFTQKGFDAPAIFEIEVTKTDRPNDNYTFEQYDLSKLVSEAMTHVSKGGIISVCTHFANPFGPERYIRNAWYTGWIDGDEGVKKMLTEGTEEHKALRDVMENTLKLIKALDDNGIPFMLRPFHEMNADWFWWCIKNAEDISAESYISLWRYFYDVVTKELGATDIVWVYAPSTNGNLGDMKADILYPYPGDEYVDTV